MDFAGIQMDDMWMDNSAPDDQRHIGLESLLDHSNGPGGPVVPDAPYTPLLRGSGNAEAHDTYAEIAALPPYGGMERLWAEQEISASIEHSAIAGEARLSQARASYEQQTFAAGSPFGNPGDQSWNPGYEFPEYMTAFGGQPRVQPW